MKSVTAEMLSNFKQEKKTLKQKLKDQVSQDYSTKLEAIQT